VLQNRVEKYCTRSQAVLRANLVGQRNAKSDAVSFQTDSLVAKQRFANGAQDGGSILQVAINCFNGCVGGVLPLHAMAQAREQHHAKSNTFCLAQESAKAQALNRTVRSERIDRVLRLRRRKGRGRRTCSLRWLPSGIRQFEKEIAQRTAFRVVTTHGPQ